MERVKTLEDRDATLRLISTLYLRFRDVLMGMLHPNPNYRPSASHILGSDIFHDKDFKRNPKRLSIK